MEKLDQLTITLKGGREIKGHFTCCRVKDASVPKGYHKYDLRHSDDDDSIIAELFDRVLVNHYGTFLSTETVEHSAEGVPVEDWNFDPWSDEYLQIS